MSAPRKMAGVTIAAAAAVLFLAGCTSQTVPVQQAEVKCAGINSCKGQSACKTASSSCKGLNSCKGQGWLPAASAEECAAQGGSVI